MYEEAFQYAMNELHEYYKSQNQEEIYNIWFVNSDIKYVSDTTDSITISVKTNFLLQIISTKGYLSELENKLREILNQSNFKLNCIVDNKPAENNNTTQEVKLNSDETKSVEEKIIENQDSSEEKIKEDKFSILDKIKENI